MYNQGQFPDKLDFFDSFSSSSNYLNCNDEVQKLQILMLLLVKQHNTIFSWMLKFLKMNFFKLFDFNVFKNKQKMNDKSIP